MLRICRIDTSKEKNAALVNWLQLEILPADSVDDVSVGCWWVVYLDGNPIGFAGLKRSSRWSNAGYLCRAGVLHKHTGKGIQKKLIRVRLTQAKRLGWDWLISDTYQNPASANNLISCGFKMYIPTRKYGADGTCYWRKKL
jgi:GNAT superfamily N-acetyltransferase